MFPVLLAGRLIWGLFSHAAGQIADDRTRYSILTSAAVSVLGFFLTLRLIPLTKAYTLKARMAAVAAAFGPHGPALACLGR